MVPVRARIFLPATVVRSQVRHVVYFAKVASSRLVLTRPFSANLRSRTVSDNTAVTGPPDCRPSRVVTTHVGEPRISLCDAIIQCVTISANFFSNHHLLIHGQSRESTFAFPHARSCPTDRQTEQAVLDHRNTRRGARRRCEPPGCSEGYQLAAAYGVRKGVFAYEI